MYSLALFEPKFDSIMATVSERQELTPGVLQLQPRGLEQGVGFSWPARSFFSRKA